MKRDSLNTGLKNFQRRDGGRQLKRRRHIKATYKPLSLLQLRQCRGRSDHCVARDLVAFHKVLNSECELPQNRVFVITELHDIVE
jgi:hypothetical protein